MRRVVFGKQHDSDSHEHTACVYKAYPKAKPSNNQKAWGSEGDCWLERRKPAREEEGYGKVVCWVSTVRVQLYNVGRSSQREISPPLELCELTDENISDCGGVGVLRIQNLITVSLVLSLAPQIAVPWLLLYQTSHPVANRIY